MCEPGTCEDCCSTDEWIVPAGLRAKGPASKERGQNGDLSDFGAEAVHVPTLTVDGPTAALRALGRDGGER